MNKYFKARGRRRSILGAILQRPTATVPQTVQYALFDILHGKVLMTSIVGEVTTDIGGALSLKLIANATASTTGDTDLCGAVDINTCVEGDVLSITGLPATNLLVAHKGSVQTMDYKGVVMQVGSLDAHSNASETGAIAWTVTYVPIDDGAEMIVNNSGTAK